MTLRLRSARRALRQALRSFTLLATDELEGNVDSILDVLRTYGFVIVNRREVIDVLWDAMEAGKIDAAFARQLITSIQEAHEHRPL